MRKDFALRHKNNFYHEITAFGGYVFCALVLLSFLILRDFKSVKHLLLGFAIIYGVTITIRALYFKERPEKFKHSSFLERLDASSFPSLHAARSALVFSALSRAINKPAFTALAVIMTLLIGFSRIKLKRHDWKDITAGMILGLAACALSSYFLR